MLRYDALYFFDEHKTKCAIQEEAFSMLRNLYHSFELQIRRVATVDIFGVDREEVGLEHIIRFSIVHRNPLNPPEEN